MGWRMGVTALLMTAAISGGSTVAGAADPEKPAVIYAAFAMKGALDEAIVAFARDGGPVRAVYGPSPALAKQIEEGAPADLFISADQDWMDEVAKHGLIKPQTRSDLVGTSLVLTARAGDATAAGLAIKPGFPLAAALGDGRIALCDPMMNPAGKSARASLTSLGVWPSVSGHVAPAENSGAALKLLESGAVPFAIVYASDMTGQSGLTTVGTFPEESHPPIVFPVALMAASTGATAPAFLGFLRSPAAATIFSRYGFTRPGRMP